MLGVTLASLIRSSWARARAGASDAPSPASPASAVPPAALDTFRKSRRLTSIVLSIDHDRRGVGPAPHGPVSNG
jgi:hypothetical protein